MEKLKDDIRFIIILFSINTLIQVISDAEVTMGVKVLFIFLSVITIFVSSVSILKKNDKKVQYGLIIYTTTFIIVSLALGIAGVVNFMNILYGLVWAVTISAYVICLSHPMISTLLIVASLVSTFIVQLIGGSELTNSFNSISGLLLVTLVFLIIYSRLIIKKQEDYKKLAFKEKLVKLFTYESKPLRVGICPHIIVWSLVITSVAYVGRTQLYNVMNADIKYVILASVSVMITTFLTIGALTASVLVIEMFAVYTAFEWYTISYLMFIPDYSWGVEVATVIIDTALLGYMVMKYRGQIKMHKEQKEVVMKNKS